MENVGTELRSDIQYHPRRFNMVTGRLQVVTSIAQVNNYHQKTARSKTRQPRLQA